MKIQHKGSMLLFPLNYYGSEETGIRRLLTEFLSICYLLEDVPPFDTMDQAREILRRINAWLIQQDKDVVGFATPHPQHLHHSMHGITELYIMATQTPWGFRAGKIGQLQIYIMVKQC